MTVLDMPRPWLAQLLQLCCPSDYLALLCTCTSLRDLVLFHARGVRLQLSCQGTSGCRSSSSAHEHGTEDNSITQAVDMDRSVPPAPVSSPQLYSLVLALSEVNSPLHLVWAASSPAANTAAEPAGATAIEGQAAYPTAAAQHVATESFNRVVSMMRAACQVPKTRTSHVTHMTLQGMLLPSLIPAALVDCLPQLQHLTLLNCTLQYTSDTFPAAPHHSHLTQLTLDHVEWDTQDPPQKPTGEDLQQFNARLSASMLPSLPHLSAVHIMNGGWEGWLQFSSCFGHQLHEFSTTAYVNVYAALNLHTLFPQLQKLELPTLQVHDKRMDVLLKLPHLKQLYIECFILGNDYTDTEGCDWDTVRIQNIDVASCARLPLHKWSRLEVCGVKPEVWLVDSGEDAAEDLALTATAMQHISHLGARAMDTQQATLGCDSSFHAGQQCVKESQQERAGGCNAQLSQPPAGITWSHEIQCVEIVAEDEDPATEEPAPPSDLILATLPLFNTYQHHNLHLRGVWPVTQALLAALGQWTSISNLGLINCTWESDGLFKSLLVTLPHVQHLQLGWSETRFQVELWELKQLLSVVHWHMALQLRAAPKTSGVPAHFLLDLYPPRMRVNPPVTMDSHEQAAAEYAAQRSHAMQVETELWQEQVQDMLVKSGLSHLITVECCVSTDP